VSRADRPRTSPTSPRPRHRVLGWVVPVALALVLLAWPLSCLVDVGSSSSGNLVAALISATAGAAPLATVFAVPLLTLAARRRNWPALAVSAVAGVLPWVFMVPYASGNEPARAAGDRPLRVMLVNAHDGTAGAGDIVAATTTNSVDVLAVTELSGTLAHDLTTAGLDRVVSAGWVRLPGQDRAPDDPESGMGVWVRPGIELSEARDVAGTRWPAMAAVLRTQGAAVTFVAGHVATPGPGTGRRWADDLATLRRATEQLAGPRVLLGNLNATSWHADLRRFSASGIRDAADVLGQGPRPTWPTWSPVPILALDHAMVAGRVGVESVQTVMIGGSDHRGLVAQLRIPAVTG